LPFDGLTNYNVVGRTTKKEQDQFRKETNTMAISERHLPADVPEAPTPVDLTPVLQRSPLFEGMQPREIGAAVRAFDEQSFNAGHRITLEGLRGSDFYVITSGRARVTVEGWKVATLEAGDFFGELGVLGDGLRFATVSAETPLRCLVLPNDGLEALIVEHPRIGVNLLRQVINRFHDLAGRRQPPAAEMRPEAAR